jgi:hypothetical protein
MTTSLHGDSVDLALRHVCETKHLLEALIHSSESFDYHAAKRHLGLLQTKIRELAKAKADLESLRTAPGPNVCTVDFGGSDSPGAAS